jgi:hypothetical protein
MNNSEENNEYKLLILDRIKDPARANAVMEVIANNRGDEALALVIDEMETVDVARLFTEAFDYTKPNQAAGLIKPDIAADCILAILARRSLSRLNENPSGTAQDINDFLTAVVLSRPIEKQSKFKDLFEDHMDLFASCMMCEIGYHGEELVNIIVAGEQGTMAEIAKNLGFTNRLLKSVKGAMGKDHIESESDADDESFDAASEERRSKFVRSTLARFHRKAIQKFGAEATTGMEEFMDM